MGVEVLATANAMCDVAKGSTLTDSSGQFTFNGESELEWFFWLAPVHRVHRWALCFVLSKNIQRTWHFELMMGPASPSNVVLSCNLRLIDGDWYTHMGKSLCSIVEPEWLNKIEGRRQSIKRNKSTANELIIHRRIVIIVSLCVLDIG